MPPASDSALYQYFGVTMSVRVRYAPSPTGDPHLGILRTAVFDYLFARHERGTFIVRLEDTDQKREKEDSAQNILESLRWLGIEPDEGIFLNAQNKIAQKGNFGPYIQSERLEIYQKHAQELIEKGAAYPCFCTSEQLQQVREEQEKNHQAPRYNRVCRDIPSEEAQKRITAGSPYVVRQKMPDDTPDDQPLIVSDLIHGEIRWHLKGMNDHVLLKSDGFPTYHLANVVDDHLMAITHVLRGDEWLPSFPMNWLLYKGFGWEPPIFAHVPVILGPDHKTKLSKRQGAEPVLSYRDKGYLPEAVLNYLAFLGWSPGTEEEFFSTDELIQRFSLDRVQKSAAIFDQDRLDFINGWYIRQLPLGGVAENMIPFLIKDGLIAPEGQTYRATNPLILGQPSFAEQILAAASAVQQRLKHFDETAETSWFFFKRPDVNDDIRTLVVPKGGSWEATRDLLKHVVIEVLKPLEPWTMDELDQKLHQYIGDNTLKNSDVLWPIRAALTGSKASPGAFEMLFLLGKEESLERLQALVV